MSFDVVVKNGRLVIPGTGIVEADVGIEGEQIAEIGRDLPDGDRVVDAAGKHVFPGCVDTHTHYGHFNEFYHEMAAESENLVSLGTTTSVILIDRCIKNMEGWKERRYDPELFEQPIEDIPGFIHAMWRASYHQIVPEVIERSERHSHNDFAFRLAMVNTDQVAEIPDYYRDYGVPSYKAWTGLYQSVSLTPPEMWVFLATCKESDTVPYVNTVNFAIQEQLTQEVEARAADDPDLTGPRLVKAARGAPLIETLDLQTTLWLAKEVGSPELCIAHVATADAVDLIRLYRQRYGLDVVGEAAGVWLDLSWPEVGERLGYMATCIIPQISDESDVDALWDAIRTGDITCIGTDGVISPTETFPDGEPNPLYAPPPTFDRPGAGFPSHICHFPVVLDTGLARGFSAVQMAEACASDPARLMRLYPKKGTIAVGSDADLVIMDLDTRHVITKDELKTTAVFNPWEGREVGCWPVLTMLRGRVVCEDGRMVAEQSGRYQPSYPD
jgi:dihydroorotase-like cyclic amidohydrolase